MSVSNKKIKNEYARAIYREFTKVIHDLEMVKISTLAGSTRRGVKMVNDIEILLFPLIIPPIPQQNLLIPSQEQSPLLSEPKNQFNILWESFIQGYKNDYIRGNLNGPKHKNLYHKQSGAQLDLYLVEDMRAWGVQWVIRTGPKEFNIKIMQYINSRGFRMQVKDGFLHGHSKQIPPKVPLNSPNEYACKLGAECPDIIPCTREDDFFEAIGLKYIPPPERIGALNKWIIPVE